MASLRVDMYLRCCERSWDIRSPLIENGNLKGEEELNKGRKNLRRSCVNTLERKENISPKCNKMGRNICILKQNNLHAEEKKLIFSRQSKNIAFRRLTILTCPKKLKGKFVTRRRGIRKFISSPIERFLFLSEEAKKEKAGDVYISSGVPFPERRFHRLTLVKAGGRRKRMDNREVMNIMSGVQDPDLCKYRNKKVVKTVDDINEFIKDYPRTNRELNTYIIKKDRGNDVSFLKSFIFYIFTQITSVLAVCLVIFCIGFLIGNHISSKSSVINSVNYNVYLGNDVGAELVIRSNSGASKVDSNVGEAKDSSNVAGAKEGSNVGGAKEGSNVGGEKEGSNVGGAISDDEGYPIFRVNVMINFNFDYNNLFMGTLISNVLLYYYPANDIGLSAEEMCYNVQNYTFTNTVLSSNRETKKSYKDNDEMYTNFLKEESLIFFNYAIKTNNNINITYVNDVLFENLNSYPIGGSDITISPGIMQGTNSINALASIHHIVKDQNILYHLLNDCKKGRIYLKLHLGEAQIKTILFHFQPQIGFFLPFKIPCTVKKGAVIGEHDEFRLNVIKNYKVQKAAIQNINFFMN
ncbi:hypothetical protein POVCU2_0036400 [Plasmodium ovale curtisi]|uniref:Uncharacterized protein n=1 Tax=Plasmodium ovale curtisi TaxID=864141 RepID=A0A1A8W574_PLAOA|nr:hypothetical protein POVCU2_0036400 [Plasmodium ovale curtisi]